MDDSSIDLLHRAQDGDATARERLYGRLLPILRKWAHGQVPERARDAIDSEDLVQDVLTETITHVREFEPHQDHGLHAYLRVALRNRVRSELRRVYRERDVRHGSVESVADGGLLLAHAVDEELRVAYERALRALPEDRRTMIVARIEFGLSWFDVAAIGGRSSGDAARMTVGRDLVRLARALGIRPREATRRR